MGTVFNPIAFISAIRELYDRVVIAGAERAVEVTSEDEHLSALLSSRVVEKDGRVLFALFTSLTLSPPTPDLIEVHGGIKYLRLDCLAAPVIDSVSIDRVGGAEVAAGTQ